MGTVRDVGRGVARGFNRLQQSGNLLLNEAGLISDEDAAKAIARDEQDAASYPASVETNRGSQKIADAKGWGATALAILTNPRAVLTVVGESLPASAAVQASGAALGLGGRSPAGLMAGTFAGSYATEYSSTIFDTMRDAGVDLSNAEQVAAALNDDKFMATARERGAKRGLPVAAFDAISFGLAGRISKVIERGGEGLVRRGAGAAAEVGAQAGAGAAGEAGAQLADKGKISSPSDVLLEAAGEVAASPTEILLGRKNAERQQQASAPEYTINDPGGEGDGVTVTISPDQTGIPPTMRRVDMPDGSTKVLGDKLLNPTKSAGSAAPSAPAGQGRAGPPPSARPTNSEGYPNAQDFEDFEDRERLNSPRLTPADRASPLPNDLIDDGKKVFEEALSGKPITPPNSAIVSPSEQARRRGEAEQFVGGISRRMQAEDMAARAAGTQPPAGAAPARVDGLAGIPAPNVAQSAPVATPRRLLTDQEFGVTPQAEAIAGETAGKAPEAPAPVRSDSSLNRTASWVIRNKDTGDVVMETFDKAKVDALNTAKYEAVPIQQHLASLNKPTAKEYLASVREAQNRQRQPGDAEVVDVAQMIAASKPVGINDAGEKIYDNERGRFRVRMDRIDRPGGYPDFGGDLAPAKAAKPEPVPVDVKQRAAPTRKGPLDIVEFLASIGGLKDFKSELRSLDLSKRFVPGIGKLIRESGKTLDYAREAAEEAGYITPAQANQTTTIADLLRAIEANERGQRVYSTHDTGRVQQRQAEKTLVENSEEQARRDDLAEVIDEYDLKPDEIAAVEEAMKRGEWAHEAIIDVIERRAIAFEARTRKSRTQKEPDFDAPFDVSTEDRAGEKAPDASGSRQGNDEGRPGRSAPPFEQPAEDQRNAGSPEKGKGQGALAEEAGADGKPQQVIPGAERISQKQQAEREASKPMRAKVPQKDAGALFDTQANSEKQGEMPFFSLRRPNTETPAFKAWFGNSKVVDENGDPLVVYHGSKRSDRINASQKFDKRRATSGPMAFFTDDPAIASSYATKKEDTSLPDEEHLAQRFVVKAPGMRTGRRIDEVWWALPPEERARIAERASRIYETDDDQIVIDDKPRKNGIGNYDYELLQARGNHLKALAESWLHSGQLFDEEERFLEVLKLAGMTSPVEYHDPLFEAGGVFPVYLSIQTPLDTDNIPNSVSTALEKAARRQRNPKYDTGKDMWDKSVQRPDEWIYRLQQDAKDGTAHAWTSIPDWVTRVLADFGYDGIKDRGGKKGGDPHTVWIPFDETQVKSVNNRGTFDPANPRILFKARTDQTVQPTDAFSEQAEALANRLRAELDRLGLKEVGLRLQRNIQAFINGEMMTADGLYFQKLITVAFDAKNPDAALTHEVIHALRELNLFSKPEWAILERMSRKKWMAKYKIAKAYGSFSDEVQVEEGIAHALADWRHGAQTDGIIAKMFKKVMSVLTAIERTFSKDFRDAEDIFKQVVSGEIGNRPRTEAQASEPRFAIRGDERRTAPYPEARRTIKDVQAAVATRIMNRIKGGPSKNDGESLGDYSMRMMVDYLQPLRRMIESQGPVEDRVNAYQEARLALDAAVASVQDMHGKYVTPAVEALAEAGASLEDLHRYLYALHAEERNRVVGLRNEPDSDFYKAVTDPSIVGASGWSTNQARRELQRFRQSANTFPGIRDAAGLIRQMLDENLLAQKNAGLISDATYQELTQQWQHYVPLHAEEAVDENGDFQMPGRGRGFDVRGKEFKGATGRFTEAENIPAWAISSTERSKLRQAKNKVGKSILRFINEFDPNGTNLAEVFWSDGPGFGDITKAPTVYRRELDKSGKVVNKAVPYSTISPDMYAVKVAGKTFYVKFADAKVGQALKNMNAVQMNLLFRLSRKLTNFQSLVNTRANPAFIPTNFFRDVLTGAIHLLDEGFTGRETAKILGDIPQAWAAVWRGAKGRPGNGPMDQALAEMTKVGGRLIFEQQKTVEESIKSLHRQMQAAQSGRGSPRAMWNGLVKLVEDVNDTVEMGIRLAAYSAARAKGKTAKQAAFMARDLTVDFRKHGEIGPQGSALYTFFNASVQGNFNVAKRLLGSRKVQAASAAIMLSGFALDVINRSIAGDDDDGENRYEKMLRNEPWKFERQMVIFYGPGEGSYFTIPLPYGYNAIYHTGLQMSAAAHGDVSPVEAMANSIRVLVDAFNPMGGGGSRGDFLLDALSLASPSATDPLVDLVANTNFYGAPIYREQVHGDTTPDAQMGKENTALFWKWAADQMGGWTGGNKIEPGTLDIHPETIEYMWDFVSGGIGRFFGQVGDPIYKAATGRGNEIEVEKLPIIRSFYGEQGDDNKRSEYYKLREDVQTAKSRLKDYKDAGDTEALQDFRDRFPVEIAAIHAFDAAEKRLRKIRAMRRRLEAGGASAERLAELDDAERKAMTAARLAYAQARQKQRQAQQ